jgi:hypothetical protein
LLVVDVDTDHIKGGNDVVAVDADEKFALPPSCEVTKSADGDQE